MATANDTPAPTSRSPRRARILLVLFAAVVVPIGASIVYTFPPSEYPYYPRCWFHWLTGLHCPGCGATRCVYALMCLDLPQAFAYNALFVLALPLFVYAGACSVCSIWTGKPVRVLKAPGWAVVIVLVVAFAFGILRNIDVEPFNLLAPRKL